jgi:hypothetical protein
MEGLSNFIKWAIDRSWAVGALLVLFCGGILAFGDRGPSVPAAVREWVGAGLYLGAALIGLSIISFIGRMFTLATHAVQDRAETRRKQREAAMEAFRNLEFLTLSEAELLQHMLLNPDGCWGPEIHFSSDAHSLVQRGILIERTTAPWSLAIQPDLRDQSEAILRALKKVIPIIEERNSSRRL